MQETDVTGNPLWTFSLRLYGRPDVQATCLELQDEAGADVNLVLFLLWCAATSRPTDADAIAAADASVAPWRRAVVEPLRGVRHATRAQLLPGVETADFRSRLKAVELEAERLIQVALLAHAPLVVREGGEPDPAQYLALYAAHLGRTFPPRAVAVLVKALLDQASSPET